MAREVIWTRPAEEDLKTIYDFLSHSISEPKAFETIQKIVSIGRILENKLIAGARHQSKIAPYKSYEKVIWKHYLILFRKEANKVYINRIFDSRQNPNKLKL